MWLARNGHGCLMVVYVILVAHGPNVQGWCHRSAAGGKAKLLCFILVKWLVSCLTSFYLSLISGEVWFQTCSYLH